MYLFLEHLELSKKMSENAVKPRYNHGSQWLFCSRGTVTRYKLYETWNRCILSTM